jgi:pectin methylesterase-like acyl-CoA thioesterase
MKLCIIEKRGRGKIVSGVVNLVQILIYALMLPPHLRVLLLPLHVITKQTNLSTNQKQLKLMTKLLQKMSLLCTLLVLFVASASAQSYTNEDFSITWSMADGAESAAVAVPDDAFISKSWGYGGALEIASTATATYFDKKFTQFTRVGDGKLANDRSQLDDSYVEFKFKPYPGMTATPASLSFDITKVGTGDPNIWVECIQGATITSISANETIRKNSEATPSESKSYDLTQLSTITSTTDETVIRIYIGKLANNKQVAIGNVVIGGKVDGTVTKYTTVYNLATAIAAYHDEKGKNIEGFVDYLPVTTAEVGSNAYDLKVDATKGKVGPNNDWAQINQGTTLYIKGVPQGATLTFSLYGSTGLTIKGVEYTNGQTYTSTKDQNLTLKCTTGGYIKTITIEGTAFVDVLDGDGYTNIWNFGKSNGAPEFALQKSPEYTYTVEGRSLVINTSSGKLNNASRDDIWAQCNDGTLFKVPVYAGSKLTWGIYNVGSSTGFTVDGQLYNEYYVSSEDGVAELTAKGIGYLSFIKIEPEELYDITGTIAGGAVDGASVLLTAENGQVYKAEIASSAFSAKIPAGNYDVDLSDDVPYVVSSPSQVNVSAAGSIGEITIVVAQPQQVTGEIVNAPSEAFTLTFTGASHEEVVNCEANATSYAVTLDPDKYTISSSVGELSALSVETFKVLKEAVSHNIYYPAAIPAATQQEITVDNTAAMTANVYNSVSDALVAAKAGNISAPVITLTSGQTYKEQIKVDMANVTLKTSGEEKATITWYYGIGYCYYSLDETGYYNKDRAMTKNSKLIKHPARWGATVLVTKNGNGFKADNIIFENSFNQRFTEEEVADGVMAYPMGDTSITYDRTLKPGDAGYKEADSKAITERAAAIGFENNPTGCELYNCVFIGSQDTYYTSGTQYVKNCDIQGNTDYIFGGGKAVFDNCNLVIGGYSDQKTSAYITAQKGNAGERYIFRDCTVTKTNRKFIQANLGRDWGGAAASVVYLNLKNEIGSDMSYTWTNMGGGVAAGTADLHIYDFDPAINANYSKTGSTGSNINGLLTDDQALSYYADVVNFLGFTPEGLYADALELDENSAYNMCRIAASDNVKRDVILNAELKSGTWSPITLPFAMTGDQIATVFGAGTKVAKLNEATATQLNYTTVEAMDAATPYLINVGQDFTTGNVEAVTILKDVAEQTVSDWKFVGGWQKVSLSATSDYFFQENAISKAALGASVNGFAAYLTNASAGDEVTFTIDGEQPTAIEAVEANAEVHPVEGAFVIGDKVVILKAGKQYNAAGARIK